MGNKSESEPQGMESDEEERKHLRATTMGPLVQLLFAELNLYLLASSTLPILRHRRLNCRCIHGRVAYRNNRSPLLPLGLLGSRLTKFVLSEIREDGHPESLLSCRSYLANVQGQ